MFLYILSKIPKPIMQMQVHNTFNPPASLKGKLKAKSTFCHQIRHIFYK